MPTPLLELAVKNYKSLRDVTVRLGPLNVLVGPNGSGKSNLLDVIQFLGDSAREDLVPALERRQGFGSVYFRGRTKGPLIIQVKAHVTSYAHKGAPDEYTLSLGAPMWFEDEATALHAVLKRSENFSFKRFKGRGWRITITRTHGQRTPTRASCRAWTSACWTRNR